jgi:pimeloyl-ACP methyl ester carboxylesterase
MNMLWMQQMIHPNHSRIIAKFTKVAILKEFHGAGHALHVELPTEYVEELQVHFQQSPAFIKTSI